jgi:hypothetical protein
LKPGAFKLWVNWIQLVHSPAADASDATLAITLRSCACRILRTSLEIREYGHPQLLPQQTLMSRRWFVCFEVLYIYHVVSGCGAATEDKKLIETGV